MIDPIRDTWWWDTIDDIQKAIFELNDFLNVNEPVRASRVLKRIQIHLDHMKDKANDKEM